jgi:heme oxygenase
MSLKELTKDRHHIAESTDFMKSVFAGNMQMSMWADYTKNKTIWYSAIEHMANKHGLLDDLHGIERTKLLMLDYMEMTLGVIRPGELSSAIEYHNYIMSLDSADNVMAHVYTWHMGDLYGGQMIKRMVSAPSRSLDFENVDELKINIRKKLKDSMVDEVNCAFDWAIRILNEYKV